MPATPTTPARSRCSPHRRPPSTRPAPGPPHGAAPTTTGPQTREPHVVPETPTELEQVVACKTSYQSTINYLRDTPLGAFALDAVLHPCAKFGTTDSDQAKSSSLDLALVSICSPMWPSTYIRAHADWRTSPNGVN